MLILIAMINLEDFGILKIFLETLQNILIYSQRINSLSINTKPQLFLVWF